jgi:hypothetical protein
MAMHTMSNSNSSTVSLVLSNPDGSCQTAPDFCGGVGTDANATGDFNRDGTPDLVTVNGASQTVSVFLGDGTGAFPAAPSFVTGSGPAAACCLRPILDRVSGGFVAAACGLVDPF